jgi:hypothetical protein
VVATAPAALVALDVERLELADQIAENDGALARHQSRPSWRSARSICDVAASMSEIFLISAAFNTSDRAEERTEHPGVNADCVVEIDRHDKT